MNSFPNNSQDAGAPIQKYPNRESSGNAILKSSSGSFGPSDVVFTAAALSQTLDQPIASVTIDTDKLHSPKLLIDFAGILTVRPITVTSFSTLYFTLFKSTRGTRVPQAVTTFSFTTNAIFAFPQSNTLKFEHSSCGKECEDCCTYTLVLSSISNRAAGTINFAVNGTISALAVESK